jgi:hypothetical protein
MKDVADSEAGQNQGRKQPSVGGPVKAAWREGTLTRARELEALRDWVLSGLPQKNYQDLSDAIHWHLEGYSAIL